MLGLDINESMEEKCSWYFNPRMVGCFIFLVEVDKMEMELNLIR